MRRAVSGTRYLLYLAIDIEIVGKIFIEKTSDILHLWAVEESHRQTPSTNLVFYTFQLLNYLINRCCDYYSPLYNS